MIKSPGADCLSNEQIHCKLLREMGVARMDADQLFVFSDRMIFKSLYCLVSPKPNLFEKQKATLLQILKSARGLHVTR